MITESLHANDLKHLVNRIFEIDSYKSKIGDDEDVIVSKKEQLQNKLNEIDRHIERKELFDFEPTPPKRRA